MINDSRYFTKAGPTRRNFLKGAGIALMLPQFASLADKKEELEDPVRVAFFTVPNGKILDKWRPKETGKNYTMSETLKPIEHLRDHFQVLTGLDHQYAYANGDGAGDHARAQGTFLTGVQVLKDKGRARAGISVDQVLAKYYGTKTYIPSLELSSRKGRLSGTCDSGYSCLYQYNFSWANEVMPMVPESSPSRAFNRLFTIKGKKKNSEAEFLLQTEKSILDLVGSTTKDLKRRLGKEDHEKLDQYYSSLRDTEKKINRDKPLIHPSQLSRDFSKEPETYAERIEMLMDVMALAFEVDSTRIATMIIADEGNNRSFPEIGVKGGHHQLSHHKEDPKSMADCAKIDLFYVQRIAHFLNALDKRKVNGKSLLEQSMIIYGSGHADGNRHSHTSLPIILAGHGGGKLKPGFHRDYGREPMCNLFVRMLQELDCPVNKFGDSTGSIKEI